MKNFFGINTAIEYDDQAYDGACYKTKAISSETADKLNKAYFEIKNVEDSVKANPVYGIMAAATGFIAACALMGFFNSLEHDHIGNPVTFIVVALLMIAVCVVFGILHSKDYEKRKAESDIPQAKKDFLIVEQAAKAELGIPLNAAKIDILAQVYTIDSKGKQKAIAGATNTHTNMEYYCYVSGGKLCITNLYGLYEVPLSSITSLIPQKKRALFPNWYKEEKINKPPYKQFKVSYDPNSRNYSSKYYSLIINGEYGEFSIDIPNYDIEAFARSTGMSCTPQN